MFKILLSPSKGQNASYSLDIKRQQPNTFEKSKEIRELMMSFDKDTLGQVLSIKGNLLDKTYEMFHEEKEAKAAIEIYNGLVFKQLDLESFSDIQLQYLQNHLVILSAMYGILEPFNLMKPYRLDMKAHLDNFDLYEFWKKTVNEYLESSEEIVNLSSNEFFKLIDQNAFHEKIIDINFKEYNKKGQLRVVAARAKKARGLFLNEMIKRCVTNIEDLKDITVLGYTFNEKLSARNRFAFIKEK